MFTGIIEEVGTVRSVRTKAHSAVLTIEAKHVLTDCHIGDSIATNGVCLTVTSFDGTSFSADVMHETLNRSSLGSLKPGSLVNLERAMRADGRFGGHIVSGHIDGIGRITSIKRDDNAIWYTIQANDHLLRYVIEKGSIAIDGISLTVAKASADSFSVSTIPHTRERTNLRSLKAGDVVNLEADIVGKYIERLLGLEGRHSPDLGKASTLATEASSGNERGESASTSAKTMPQEQGITLDFLLANGF